jgi:hypothetical protein
LEIDPEEFKRRYAELSDEGLLSIDRTDLIELAQTYYDAEVASRGLHPAELATPTEPVHRKTWYWRRRFCRSKRPIWVGRCSETPTFLHTWRTSLPRRGRGQADCA